MRKFLFGLAAVLMLGAAVGGTLAARRPAPALQPGAGSALAPAAFVTVAPDRPAGAKAAAVQVADATPPVDHAPVDHAMDLPTIVVKEREVHTVPEDAPPPPGPVVTMSAGRAAERAAALVPAASVAAIRALPPPGPGRLDGTAQAASGMSISVAGRPVRLFGVRLPAPRERCTLATGASQACAAAAQAALAGRLAGYRDVSCQSPPGQQGEPGFVCRDSAGVDLGGYIVAQGFALADTRSSYQYVNAENAARAYHRGLWHQP